jgi:hypothetical protein
MPFYKYEWFCTMQMKTIILATIVASAAAFAPAANQRTFSTALNLEMGRYDGKLWDNNAKKEVYAAWSPTASRSVDNFNPFETWDGNSPDCSGRYPGETGYKDPARGDINFAQMMIERQEIEERSKFYVVYPWHASLAPTLNQHRLSF